MIKSQHERLSAIVREFKNRRVIVVGDLIADQFLYGEISRVSREAPVLILRHERTENVPGGAANCAMNLAALGANISIIGVVGEDKTGRTLVAALETGGVDCTKIIACASLATTTKTRILAGLAHSLRQQVIRVDYENTSQVLPDDVRKKINANLSAALVDAEAVIISDYNYGVIDANVREVTRNETAKSESIHHDHSTRRNPARLPVLVDSRFRLREFENFTTATPNEDEIEHIIGRRLDDVMTLEIAGEELRAQLQLEALLITCGKNGMVLFESDKPALHIAPVGSRDAVDVTGAGDTVIATYALSLAAGATFIDAAQLANHAGAIVVMKRGTATVNQEELLAFVQHED